MNHPASPRRRAVSRGRRWALLVLSLLLVLGGGLAAWNVWKPTPRAKPPRHTRAASVKPPRPGQAPRLAQAPTPAAKPEPAAPPAPPPEPPVTRSLPPPSPRALKLQQLGEKLGARGAPLENPCLTPSGADCARNALTPFFKSLDALAAGQATSPTVISAFGNSLIAGDRIVDIIREELGFTFGDGGRGVMLVDRLAAYGPRVRTGYARGGWKPRTLGEVKLAELPFGITGVYHEATTPKSRSRFALSGEPRATLWWLDVPRSGALSLQVDGKEVARTEPTGSGEARSLAVDLPEGARHLDVVAKGRGGVVQGVVLQQERPGIVLDTLGVPSADANLFLRAREDIFRAQLVERQPSLLLFILGGNEAKRLEWGRSNMEEVEQGLRDFVRRARTASPDSACLVVGPIDAVRGGKGSQRLAQRPYLDEVIALERQVALAEGCAFFDTFQAMGGSGSLARFVKEGMVHADLVHPRGNGLDLLGQLVTDALLQGWVEAKAPRKQAALAPELRALEDVR